MRDAIPAVQELSKAEFSTLRLRLVNCRSRSQETASRVRLAFAASCLEADLFRGLVHAFTSRPH